MNVPSTLYNYSPTTCLLPYTNNRNNRNSSFDEWRIGSKPSLVILSFFNSNNNYTTKRFYANESSSPSPSPPPPPSNNTNNNNNNKNNKNFNKSPNTISTNTHNPDNYSNNYNRSNEDMKNYKSQPFYRPGTMQPRSNPRVPGLNNRNPAEDPHKNPWTIPYEGLLDVKLRFRKPTYTQQDIEQVCIQPANHFPILPINLLL